MSKTALSTGSNVNGSLKWEVFVAPGIPTAASDLPPGTRPKLTTIYATHGHGDHFFGIGALLDRFPNARAVATPDVVKAMRQQASPQSLASFWNPFFPSQISNHL